MSANLDQAIALAMDVQRDKARGGLLGFSCYTKPDFSPCSHHRIICKTINGMYRGATVRQLLLEFGHSNEEIEYMLEHPHPVTKLYAGCTRPEMIDKPFNSIQIHMPPRHGKTELISRRTPAWRFGVDPNTKVIAAAYGAELSIMANRDVQRIIDSERYRELFPNTRLNSSNIRTVATGSWLRNSDHFEIVNHEGSYRNAGINGTMTGMGATCLTGEALVNTERGMIRIDELVRMDVRPRVWGIDVETGQRKLCKVKAVQQKIASRLVTASFDNGRSITCTPEHLFLTTRGCYRPAQVLADCRCTSRSGADFCAVCDMFARECVSTLSGGHEDQEKSGAAVLRQKMLAGSAPDQSTQHDAETMRRMRQNLQPAKQQRSTMLKSVCSGPAQSKNDGEQQPDLSARAVQRDVSSSAAALPDEEDHQAARQYALRYMRQRVSRSFDVTCASHRRGSVQQHAAQSSDVVSIVSFDGTSQRQARCTAIDSHSCGQFEVFDLEVEGTGNYFANSLCVKNCAIVDDPFKNRKQAESPVERQNVASWYSSTLYTRLEGISYQMLVNTRWHESDLSGITISKGRRDENATQWFVLVFPAILDCEPGPGDFRAQGEPLWESKYNRKRLDTIRATIGPYEFDALYQQRPSPGKGGVIQSSWWQYYDSIPTELDGILISADLTFGDRNDYVVFQVWGYKGAMRYLLEERRDRVSFTGQVAIAVALAKRYPHKNAFLVEKSANGEALVDVMRKKVSGMIPVPVHGSKSLRLDAVAPQIQAGNVVLPSPTLAPWIEEWVEEFKAFPNGAHDDRVDACSQALEYLRTEDMAFEPLIFPDLEKESEWNIGLDAPDML